MHVDLNTINQIVMILSRLGIITILFGALKKYGTYLVKKQKMKKAEIETLRKTQETENAKLHSTDKNLQYGIVAILHHEIYLICNQHLNAGYVSVDEFEELRYLYDEYAKLGGNGTGKALFQKVQQLPFKDNNEGVENHE